MLQSKAGYIDARPLTASSTKISCNARPDHTSGSKAVDREFPLKLDPDRFGANPHPRKVHSDSISAAVCYEVPKSSYICNSGRALRPRRARPANNSFTKFEFNQAWLAES